MSLTGLAAIPQIVDVASQEPAVELAAMIPDAHWSAVEVRPIIEGPEEG